MSKYIKATYTADVIHDKYGIPIVDLVDAFVDIPAADVKKVQHGKWIYNDGLDICCSLCGCDALIGLDHRQVRSNYCPHCGAKMDEFLRSDTNE